KWQCEPPGVGEPFLCDPVWPAEGALDRFALVALSLKQIRGLKSVFEPFRLWRLELSPDLRTIVAAGPLSDPVPQGGAVRPGDERFLSIAASGERATLVYLKKAPGKEPWSLCCARLEMDRATGRPRINSTKPSRRVLGTGIATVAPIVSCDQRTVYARGDSSE